jgi:hypothetical protein
LELCNQLLSPEERLLDHRLVRECEDNRTSGCRLAPPRKARCP